MRSLEINIDFYHYQLFVFDLVYTLCHVLRHVSFPPQRFCVERVHSVQCLLSATLLSQLILCVEALINCFSVDDGNALFMSSQAVLTGL